MIYNKITISGRICTGKTTLAKNLEKKLGWKFFSTGKFFRDYAKKNNLNLDVAQEQSEKITKKIDYKVQKILLTKKNIVVDSWMAGIMAKDIKDVFKILLVCKNIIRFERFSVREKISLKESEERIQNREKSLFSILSKIYNRNDFTNEKKYDLVIDTSSKTSQQILDTVLNNLSP